MVFGCSSICILPSVSKIPFHCCTDFCTNVHSTGIETSSGESSVSASVAHFMLRDCCPVEVGVKWIINLSCCCTILLARFWCFQHYVHREKAGTRCYYDSKLLWIISKQPFCQCSKCTEVQAIFSSHTVPAMLGHLTVKL